MKQITTVLICAMIICFTAGCSRGYERENEPADRIGRDPSETASVAESLEESPESEAIGQTDSWEILI